MWRGEIAGKSAIKVMPRGGLEPPRALAHCPLKTACLPSSTISALISSLWPLKPPVWPIPVLGASGSQTVGDMSGYPIVVSPSSTTPMQFTFGRLESPPYVPRKPTLYGSYGVAGESSTCPAVAPVPTVPTEAAAAGSSSGELGAVCELF